MDLTNETRNALDDAHWATAKQIQHLPKNVPNPAVLPQLGWWTLSAHIDYIGLLFLWRILLLPMGICKQIAIMSIMLNCTQTNESNMKSPINVLISAARRYNLLNYIVECVTK